MSNITPGHVRAFQLVRSPMNDYLTLSDCTINGEAGVAIVMVEPINEQQIGIMPLFVAITPGMKIDFPDEQHGGSGGGGGPTDPREAFHAAKVFTEPLPA